ncbi:MAG: BON domain-containing protein, partial [Moraxellaceae bacterium]|nr:BON domain-containing protein [Moraxellaceae bacterium]
MHKPSLTILLAVAVSTAGCTSMAKVGIGPNPAEAGTRTISDRLTDSQLAQAIRRDIYRDIPSARDARIVVVSFYQAVLIVGEAQTEEMKQAVSNAARNYKDVVIVHNEMTVGPNRTLGQRLSDD